MGNEEGIEQEVWSWNVMDRTREGSTVLSVDSGGTAATVKITTNFDWTSDAKGYLIVGDLVRFESGEVGRVTATGDSSATPGKQEVDLVRQAGGNWSAALVSATDAFGHVGTAFGEASSAPEGRLYLPTEEYNYLHIHRRSMSISGTELTNKTYIGDGSAWYFEAEDIMQREFTRDKEGIIMFGVQSSSGVQSTRGIWDYAVTYGVNNGFAAATGVTELDLQEHIKDLLIENVSNEIFVLCGASFLADAQRALKDYALNGAMSYGTLGDNTAGLDFHTYKFMGKTIHFIYYELFEDQSMVPTPVNGVDASSRADFSNTSLWLDLGSENNGRPLISLKYKAHGGINRKFVHGYEVGMVNANGQQGGQVSSGDDKFTIHLLSHFGVEVRLPNRLGILRATS